MSYKVFLSYSWSNSAERRALTSELEHVKSVEILVDKSQIAPGDAIHSTVSAMIDAADCVVVFLTDDGLQSREVLDEISRSHDRGKYIIPVVADGTKLESLPWYIRDVNYIKYNDRNFDHVAETIVFAVSSRANPLDNPDANVPDRLKNLVDSGVRFIDVPLPHYLEGDSILAHYLFCELRMRETNHTFVFRAANGMQVSEAARYLARELLPKMRRESYEWTFIHNGSELSDYHSLETSGIRSGDVVALKGNHRRPMIQPNIISHR